MFSEVYGGDDYKPTIEPTAITTLSNILTFLDASPMTLFEGPPEDYAERERFYEDTFESFIPCLVVNNEAIRRLAVPVAKRILADDNVLQLLRSSKKIDSPAFKIKFWKLT